MIYTYGHGFYLQWAKILLFWHADIRSIGEIFSSDEHSFMLVRITLSLVELQSELKRVQLEVLKRKTVRIV